MTQGEVERVRDIACVFEPVAWEWAEANSARIDAHWQALKADHPSNFDGRVLLLHRGRREGDVFRGAYLETRFSRFLAWRDFGFPDTTKRNCFAMAALRAQDGAFLLGVMGPHTANAGKVYFPAGTPDPSDLVAGSVDLAGSLVRELAEETGLGPADVVIGEGWTLSSDGQRLACLREAVAWGDAASVRARILDFLAGQAAPELSDIVVVRGPGDVDPTVMPPFVLRYLEAHWTSA